MKVVDVVEAGHYEKTVANGKGKKQVCRADGEDFPCAMILAARKEARASRGSSTATTGSTT